MYTGNIFLYISNLKLYVTQKKTVLKEEKGMATQIPVNTVYLP